MNRFASKGSLADSTTSLRMDRADHTHVIIQNPKSNNGVIKYLTLPIENLVNFGRPLKVNDLVTYKIDLKSRGTNRGKILLFGTEDDCAEQVQVLSSVAEENEGESVNHGVVQTFDTCDISSFDDPSPRHVHAKKGTNKENTNKQQYSMSSTKQSLKTNSKGPSHNQSIKEKKLNNSTSNQNQRTDKLKSTKALGMPFAFYHVKGSVYAVEEKSSNNNRMNTKSQNNVRTSVQTHEETFAENPTTTDRTVASQKTLDQMLKKVVIVGKITGSKSSLTYEKKDDTPKKLPSSITSTASSSKHVHVQKTPTSSSSKSSSVTTSKHQQMKKKGLDLVDDVICVDKEQMNVDKVALDLGVDDKDYYVKEYNRLYHKNEALQANYDKLVLAYRQLKNNTIPIRNEAVRNWIIDSARLLAPTAQIDVKTIAESLNVDVKRLTDCRRRTATHTVREIIKLIYTPEELQTKRGPDVSPTIKQLIKKFVEHLHGIIIEERPFKEAINGVFRNTSHNEKRHNQLTDVVEEDRVECDNDPPTASVHEVENDFIDLACQEEEEDNGEDNEDEDEDDI